MATTASNDGIADGAQTAAGQKRIECRPEMPVLGQIRERFEAEKPLDGIRMTCPACHDGEGEPSSAAISRLWVVQYTNTSRASIWPDPLKSVRPV